MTRSFPHLGFDPAPGDVEQTRGLARQIGNLSADLNTTVIDLRSIARYGARGPTFGTRFTRRVARRDQT